MPILRMQSIERDLSLFKKLLPIVLMVAATFGATLASAQGVGVREARVEVVSNQNLRDSQRSSFREFSSDPSYYGAMYVSPNGAYAWNMDINSMEAAEVLAKHSCESSGAQCSLYARSVPASRAGQEPFGGLAMSQAPGAVQWIRQNRGRDNAVALAASPYWGYWTQMNSRGTRVAETRALRECQRSIESRMSEWLEPDEIQALQRAGLFDCRIIVSIRGR